jgi:hypothetical protein
MWKGVQIDPSQGVISPPTMNAEYTVCSRRRNHSLKWTYERQFFSPRLVCKSASGVYRAGIRSKVKSALKQQADYAFIKGLKIVGVNGESVKPFRLIIRE